VPVENKVSPTAPEQGLIAVQMVYGAAARQVLCADLQVAPGTTAAAALRMSRLAEGLDAALLDSLELAVAGRRCQPTTVLRDGDRLELLRPLIVDPKEARRQRYKRDGVRRIVKRQPLRQRPSER
jgi:hypothetical protein